MQLPNFRYCYIDKVYTNSNDESLLYQLFLSTGDFTKVYSLVADKSLLSEMTNRKDIVTDFYVEDGMLHCEDVDRIMITDEIREKELKVIEVYDDNYNFYNFIMEGIENDYLFVGDSLSDCTLYKGTEISSFKNIRFSKSTMTVLVPIYSEEGLYNKMLITVDEGVLQLETFYFAVPEGVSTDKHTFLHTIQINNVNYNLYRSKPLNIYTENYVTSKALLNKACIMRVKYQSIIDTLSDFKSMLVETEHKSTQWCGGTKDYTEPFGIYFKPSCKTISKTGRYDIIDFIQGEVLKEYKTYNEAVSYVSSIYDNLIARACAIAICFCCYNSDSMPLLLEYIQALSAKYKKELLFTELFLYTVRTGAYIRKRYLVSPMNPMLGGSDERDITIVEQNFKSEVNYV